MSSYSESELYECLEKFKAKGCELECLGYPQEDISFNADKQIGLRRKPPSGVALLDAYQSTYKCKRCKTVYRVDLSTGIPESESGPCIYHPGTVYIHELNNQYNCCRKYKGSAGCCQNRYHVHEQQAELCNYTGYVKTQPRGEAGRKVFAMDGEMCFTTVGLELTEISLVDYNRQVVYRTLCKPSNPILDYNTKYTGLREGDLDGVAKTLPDVQRDLLDLISAETILVGHGLEHDLIQLKMFHGNIVDTVALYPHRYGLPRKNALRTIVKKKTGVDIQTGPSHDCAEDARAALGLAKMYLREMEPKREIA